MKEKMDMFDLHDEMFPLVINAKMKVKFPQCLNIFLSLEMDQPIGGW